MKIAMNKQIADSQTKLLERLLMDRQFANISGRHPAHARILDFLSPENGTKLLELGCGPGKYVALLCNAGFDVVAVDPHHFPTWELIKKHTAAEMHDKVFAESLPYADNSFDHVACLGALLYFKDPEQAMKEIRRVLKPGGRLVMRTVNKGNLFTARTGKRLDPASNQLYTMPELINLVKAHGFSVVDSFSHGFWPPALTNLWWYLACVWVPSRVQDFLSRRLAPENRVNNVVFAQAI
jgi:SAM-dependent methyltransferase